MPTLWLEEKLASREPITPDDVARLVTEFSGIPGAKRETRVLDFKERYDGTALAKVSITKSLCEFANSFGGVLVYGVDDSGNRPGLTPDAIDRLDPARIQDAMGKYISATGLSLNAVPTEVDGRLFVGVVVYPSLIPVVMEANGEYETTLPDGTKQKKNPAFYEGTILVREGAKGERAKQTHIDRLVDRLASERSRLLLRRIEMIAHLPDNVDLIAMTPGSVKGARLLGSEKGIPVRVVDDDTSAAALPVTEILTSAPFGTPEQAVMAQVRLYRTDATYRVPSKTVVRWYLDLSLVPEVQSVSELAFLSALRGHGFPMFWAAQINRERLRQLVLQILDQQPYPDIVVLPYVVCAFFWNEREVILRGVSSRYSSVTKTIRKVLNMDAQDFFYRSRVGVRTSVITGDGSTLYFVDAERYREMALRVFQDLLRLSLEDQLKADKSAAHQLDIALFGDIPE